MHSKITLAASCRFSGCFRAANIKVASLLIRTDVWINGYSPEGYRQITLSLCFLHHNAIKASRRKAGGSIAPHTATVCDMTQWRQVNCYLWNYLSHDCENSHYANHKLRHSSAMIFDSSWTNTLVGLLNPEYRCNRGFYCRSYCLLNMFRASLCPSSGAQEYYTVVAACGISCCGFFK